VSNSNKTYRLAMADQVLDLSTPKIMGVVNLTADSFSDGGQFFDTDVAEAHARELAEQGADILDLGAESTRPGAQPASPEDECARLLPLIERLTDIDVPISVDTRHPETMRAVIDAGVQMINDVNALQAPGAVEAVAAGSCAVCLMHMQGNPLTMQRAPVYRSVVSDVGQFLKTGCERVRRAGVAADRIVVDPGIGFGKTLAHNLALIRECGRIGADCDAPVLVGASRKSMLGEITGRDVHNRLPASLSAALAAVDRGASIIRVHDVQQTRDALLVWQAVQDESSKDK
jgi:dihydropteroate synthase